METTNTVELSNLPRFVSHKTVRATQITGIEPHSPDSDVTVLKTNDGDFHFAPSELEHKPEPKVGMYLVQYENNGYISFSPADAFEGGYSRI